MQPAWIEKLYFPARLTGALAGILSNPVTVVNALPGSGKTTAIRYYLAKQQEKGTRVLWYTSFGESLDTAWKQICDLLGELDAQTAGALYALHFPVQETLSTLAKVIPQLQCSQETVLAIDNSHLFMHKLPYVYELLNALALHGNKQFHLVIVTQTPMGAHMVPMSTEGVLFIDARPFIFNEADAVEYFRQNGVALTEVELGQVMDNTFGWITALHMQLLSFRETGVIEKAAGLERLMDTMMWESWSVEAKSFLLAFSKMKKATLRQLRMVTTCKDITQNMVNLLDRGAFIQYDKPSGTYTLHKLLREYLDPHFEELPRKEQQLLYTCVGRAHLLEGELFPALRMLFLAGEYEEMMAISITNDDIAEFKTSEVLPLLGGILNTCPPELLFSHPVTLLRFAFESGLRGDIQLYTNYRIAASHALKTSRSAAKKTLRGEYIFLYSFSFGNNLVKMNTAQKAALKALGGPSHVFDRRYHWTFGVPSVFAQCWSDHAPLAGTLDFLERSMPDFQALTQGNSAGSVELMRAEVLLNTGRLNDAEAMCHKAVHLANTAEPEPIHFCVDLILGRIAILRGDATAYNACLESIRYRASLAEEKPVHLLADQSLAFLRLLLGRTQDAAAWLQNETDIRNTLYYRGASYGMLLLGKYLLLRKDYNYLRGIADSVLAVAKRQHVLLTQVYYYLYLACAGEATGANEDAHHYLRCALDIALPDEIYLPFAEHAAQLADPLAAWCRMNEQSLQAKAIQRLAKLHHAGATRIVHRLFGAGSELTPREAEMANYAKEGLSNKQIAEILYVSPETVKKTMARVFSKLEIRSRRQLEDIDFSSNTK